MHTENSFHIAADHPAFAGHFPGAPIVPGVVLLDAAVHSAMQMLCPASMAGAESAGAVRCSIGSAKFLRPVGPGETLLLCLDSTAAGRARFEISCRGATVATGTLELSSHLD